MKNFFVAAVGRVIIVINNKIAPTDEEWSVFMQSLGEGLQKAGTEVCVFVFTDGGAPNAGQRKRLSELLQGRDLHVAVHNNAMIPRFVVASISLFNKSIRSYSPEEFPLACKDRKLSQQELEAVLASLEEAQTKLKTAAVESALKTKGRT